MYQIDHTKTTLENLTGLVNQGFNVPSGEKLQAGDFLPNNPIAIVPAEANGFSNTSLTLNGVPAQGRVGSTSVQYNRISLIENRPSAGDSLLYKDGDTAEDVKAAAALRWRLVGEELNFNVQRLPAVGKSRQIRFTPKANSLIYTPDSNLDLRLIHRGVDLNPLPSGMVFGFNPEPFPENSLDMYDEKSGDIITPSGNVIIKTPTIYPAQVGIYGPRTLEFMAQNDYVRISKNTIPNILEGDFTIEVWWNTWTFVATTYFAQWRNDNVAQSGFRLWKNAFNPVAFQWGPAGTGALLTMPSGTNANTWNHIAVTRQGNTFRLWSNGVAVATATNATTNPTGVDTDYLIGATFESNGSTITPSHYASGHLNQLAVHNYAKYTETFTPASFF